MRNSSAPLGPTTLRPNELAPHQARRRGRERRDQNRRRRPKAPAFHRKRPVAGMAGPLLRADGSRLVVAGAIPADLGLSGHQKPETPAGQDHGCGVSRPRQAARCGPKQGLFVRPRCAPLGMAFARQRPKTGAGPATRQDGTNRRHGTSFADHRLRTAGLAMPRLARLGAPSSGAPCDNRRSRMAPLPVRSDSHAGSDAIEY